MVRPDLAKGANASHAQPVPARRYCDGLRAFFSVLDTPWVRATGYLYLSKYGHVNSVVNALSLILIRDSHSVSGRSSTVPARKRLGFPEVVWLTSRPSVRSATSGSQELLSCSCTNSRIRRRLSRGLSTRSSYRNIKCLF